MHASPNAQATLNCHETPASEPCTSQAEGKRRGSASGVPPSPLGLALALEARPDLSRSLCANGRVPSPPPLRPSLAGLSYPQVCDGFLYGKKGCLFMFAFSSSESLFVCVFFSLFLFLVFFFFKGLGSFFLSPQLPSFFPFFVSLFFLLTARE